MADTKELKEALQRELASLAQARDELKLQIHLGKNEVRDEWARLEKAWQGVESEIKRSTRDAQEPIEHMGAAVHELIDELKRGYTRVRDQLKEERS